MDIEKWTDVKGYEGLYKVSTFGNVKSIGLNKKERILKPEITKNNRCLVKLSKNGQTKKYQVHILVASAFIDNPYFYEQVNHLDENPQNNNVDNLEWCTGWYNNCYSMEKHLIAVNNVTHERKFYCSVNSTVYDGFNKGHVGACCRGEEVQHKGWSFKYIDNEKYVLGIDQSYTRTAISLLCDGIIVELKSINFENCISNTDKRKEIKKELNRFVRQYRLDKRNAICICERIRLFSQGHISVDYMLSTSALIATIEDVLMRYNLPVYSVETKSWKSQIVGNSKPLDNPYGIDKEKYRTILYLRDKGLLKYIAEPYKGRGEKGVIKVKIDGQRVPCKINDDLADSYCIAMYGFLPKTKQKLKEEKF